MTDAPLLPAPPSDLLDGASLLLDFDGTLVELAARHDEIVAGDALIALLHRLAAALGGRIAVVSGRPVDEICGYLRVDPAAPGFGIAGSHGLEHVWPDGSRSAPDRPASLDRAIATLAAEAGSMPGVVVETKPFGVALHYRQAPGRQAACDALAERVAADAGLALQRGKMVYELKLGGADKGDAVRRFLGRPPMSGTRAIFVGDDLTDEAGFAAANAVGGAGILVGARAASVARFGLPNVPAVHRWLADAADRATAASGGATNQPPQRFAG